jgi:hypothetical protein
MTNATDTNWIVLHSTVRALYDPRNTVIRADSAINPDGTTQDIKLQFLQASHERRSGTEFKTYVRLLRSALAEHQVHRAPCDPLG